MEQAVVDARAIVEELRRYDPELAAKPRWLVLNKLDMVTDPEDTKRRFIELYDWKGPVFGISGLSGDGTQDLIYALQDYLDAEREKEQLAQDQADEMCIRDSPRARRSAPASHVRRIARAGRRGHERPATAHARRPAPRARRRTCASR